MENKVEQIETFIDKPARETVEVKGEQKFIDEVAEMYAEVDGQLAESVEKFATLEKEFEDFKAEYADKKFAVVIDEVEYDIDGVCEKYSSELAQKEADYSDLNAKFEEVNNELESIKEQVKLAAEEKLCDDGCKMIDEEDELDDDEKEEMKKACKNKEYSSIEAVEDDIAKRLYAKKKSNRQKNFKSNIGSPSVKTSKITLKEYVGR
jgi:chromosome segregation ATPase